MLLTFGQAACLVLDMPPTDDNREKAKKYFKESPLTVTYISQSNPKEPVAMAKSAVERNPYKYNVYPPTPPIIPTESFEVEGNDDFPSDIASVSSENSDSSTENSENYSKRCILKFAKIIITATDPRNPSLYKAGLYTNSEIFEILQKQFPRLDQVYTKQKIYNWLGKDKYFGVLRNRRVNGVQKKGRQLWVLHENVVENLQERNSAFRTHVKNGSTDWINVGYIRKSPTSESPTDRARLLNLMITRLMNRCFCVKMFASPTSKSGSSMFERDYKKPDLTDLINCDGDTQDLLRYLSTSLKKVRLCVIDYAGLSTDPEDVLLLLRNYRIVKEVAVDHGLHIEILDRFKLVHGKEKTNMFNCRQGLIQRSKP